MKYKIEIINKDCDTQKEREVKENSYNTENSSYPQQPVNMTKCQSVSKKLLANTGEKKINDR